MSSSSSTASSDTFMTGQVPSEEDVIPNAGIVDMFAAEIDANMNPPTGRPTGGTAMQMSSSPETSPIHIPEQSSSNVHPQARDRKRRLTSHNHAARLQRTRSGGAIRQEVNVQAALPHRSVSMVVPGSQSSSSKATGSSYATAIDITSSPPDDGYPPVDRSRIGHGAAGGSSAFRGSSSRSRVDDTQDTSTRITSRGQNDPRLDISSHMLSSAATSTSHTSDGSNDRPGYQTWHSASGPGAEVYGLSSSRKHQGRRPLPWDPPLRRSSQGSSGNAWGSRMEENPHQGIADEYTGGRYLNRGPDMTRSSVSSMSPAEGDIGRPHLRADSSNFPRFTDDGDGNFFETLGGRSERVVVNRRRTFSANSGEASRTMAGPDQGEYGRYPEYQDYEMPRWQPDAEVTSCPICGTVFTFWYRKHHCRKCGRVVCASCSPHSIVIPRQFIVRPPDFSTSLPSSSPSSLAPIVDLTGEPDPLNSSLNPALGGGEKVRLCNPCVPDPNPNPLGYGSPRAHGHRSTHSLTSSTMGNKNSRVARENPPSRQGRRTVGANDRPSTLQGLGHPARSSVTGAMDRARSADSTSLAGTSAAALPPPPAPEVSEEDLCPVCGRRFPMLSNEHTQDHREEHVRECIAGYGASPVAVPVPREAQHADLRQQPPPPPRLSPAAARMLPFTATEKDCLGEDGSVAECTICMEEYEVGQSLARLSCFCKFHQSCIVDWFERKMECPVHKA